MKNDNTLHLLGGFISEEELKDSIVCIPWGRARTLPQVYPIVSCLLLLCLCIPSFSWLAAVQIYHLGSRKVMEAGVCSLPARNGGCRKISVPRSPIGSCSVPSLYSRMYRNMDTMIFSLFWLFPLHLFLVQSHIMCNICVIL